MSTFLAPLLTVALTGCLAEVKLDLDSDEDGLLDSIEASIGTDPSERDSDGDDYDDGDEVTRNTDPTDAGDKPYQAGWPIDACRGDPGEDAESNFELLDQFGETVRLHDFCDQVVYMVFAAFW